MLDMIKNNIDPNILKKIHLKINKIIIYIKEFVLVFYDTLFLC